MRNTLEEMDASSIELNAVRAECHIPVFHMRKVLTPDNMRAANPKFRRSLVDSSMYVLVTSIVKFHYHPQVKLNLSRP
jgi:hypothetical protein